ncbi:hypothetical protein LEP1GSC109_0999 [Leptospira interrogans str. UI 13372]|nr:hypothetical protein LEP1GSC109_0999 [Leptospira interrogans str. UI 13372]
MNVFRMMILPFVTKFIEGRKAANLFYLGDGTLQSMTVIRISM